MIEPPDRARFRSDTVVFVGCLLLATGMMFVPPARTERVASGIRNSVLLPIVWLQQRAAEAKTSRARLTLIQAQRDSIALLAQTMPALREENDRLRQLLELGQRTPLDFVPAEILHQVSPTDGLTLLLSVGTADGVEAFQPVVSPEGLLGVVSTADRHTSIVTTWAHPEFRASALTEGGGVFGIVAPAAETSALLELRGVPYRDTIPAGTLVLTSGLGGVYPKGIPVGRVMGVVRELSGWERTYQVRPAANPAQAAHALVLKSPAGSSMEEAFPAEGSQEP
jgi:rod shape-determining protein MreC